MLSYADSIELAGDYDKITTLSFDHISNRLAIATKDSKICLWDLNNLKSSLNPFRIVEVFDKQPVNSLSFSSDFKKLFVIGGAKPKIFSRDGQSIVECIKGDPYIRDQRNSKGHFLEVTDGFFIEENPYQMFTCSLDGSIRGWDLNSKPFGIEKQLISSTVMVFNSRGNRRRPLSKISQFKEKQLVSGFEDGGLVLVDFKNKNTILSFNDKDLKGPISAIKILKDLNKVSIRNSSYFMLFDIRKPGNVLHKINALTDENRLWIEESIDKDILLTNMTDSEKHMSSIIGIDINSGTTKTLKTLPTPRIASLCLTSKPDRLMIALEKKVEILFQENDLLAQIHQEDNKILKKRDLDYEPIIYVPNNLPLFRDQVSHKRRRFDKLRNDEKLTQKPMEILTGPGYDGLVSAPRTTAQNIMKELHRVDSSKFDIGRLYELPKYGSVSSAYIMNQPKTQLDTKDSNDIDLKVLEQLEKCPHCGLKICQCKIKNPAL